MYGLNEEKGGEVLLGILNQSFGYMGHSSREKEREVYISSMACFPESINDNELVD